MPYPENRPFSELLLRVERHKSRNLPFVAFRNPGEKTVRFGFQKSSEVHYVKEYMERGFVFAPFDPGRPALLLVPDEIHSSEYEGTYKRHSGYELPEDEQLRQAHIDLVEKGIEEIRKGVLEKVVLSRRLKLISHRSFPEMFRKLLDLYPEAFCYVFFHPEAGLWLGATPEIFLESEKDHFSTVSLAGTLKADRDDKISWGEKEKEEQAVVTRYILDRLSENSENLEISGPISVRAGNVWHLKSKISGIISAGGIKEIISRLHPTPAVCGTPLSRAKAFIRDNEGYERTYYTGFLGTLNWEMKGTNRLYVNLRCMQLMGNQALVYVGGGITVDSIPEQEWEETQNKSTTMGQILFN